jgi:hypothetical protein
MIVFRIQTTTRMSDDVNSFLLLLVVLKCVASYALNSEFLESQVLDNTGSMVKDDQQKNVHIKKCILSHRFRRCSAAKCRHSK